MIEVKAFRTFIRIHSLFNSKHLIANITLTLHNALIRSVMTYSCLAWEFAADTHLSKEKCPQNNVLCTTGNFPRCILVHNLHMAFNLLYVYDL
jgi:hypothetical protein